MLDADALTGFLREFSDPEYAGFTGMPEDGSVGEAWVNAYHSYAKEGTPVGFPVESVDAVLEEVQVPLAVAAWNATAAVLMPTPDPITGAANFASVVEAAVLAYWAVAAPATVFPGATLITPPVPGPLTAGLLAAVVGQSDEPAISTLTNEQKLAAIGGPIDVATRTVTVTYPGPLVFALG